MSAEGARSLTESLRQKDRADNTLKFVDLSVSHFLEPLRFISGFIFYFIFLF